MGEILKALGSWAVVPAASLALAGYVISMLTGLHRTRSQARIEFLGLWRGAGHMDDMALEVAVRHLCGSYLPARVIRRICSSDHCAEGIFQVAQLWPLFLYDAASGSVSWVNPEYVNKKKLVFRKRCYTLGYFLLAMAAFWFLSSAINAGPKSILAWVYALNSLVFPVLAFSSLAKSEIYTAAQEAGAQWVEKLNSGMGGAGLCTS